MSDEQQMAKMEQMAQQMMQMAGSNKKDHSRITEIVNGETHTWGDGRMRGRFSKPRGEILNPVTGQDPLKTVFHKSREKSKPLDFDEIQNALCAPGIYDSNFQPLHEIITHPHWSDQEKVLVLKKCLEFGPDVNQRGFDQETPFEYALRLKDPKMARAAAMALVEHGADLNTMNKKGAKALHHVMMAGHPELIPALLARQASDGKTAAGASLSHIALDRFEKTMHLNVSNDPAAFENALNTYYQSMAYIKRYKLHQGPFTMEDHRRKLLDITKSQPGYRKFIDDIEEKIDIVLPIDTKPKIKLARAYTNPGHGYNYEIQDGNDSHPWLTGFSSFMDKLAGKMAKSNYIQLSKKRCEELIQKPELINNANVQAHIRSERKKFDIDYVSGDKKINPQGDTLLTRLARIGNVEGISALVDMNANLNARDLHGNTAMHLLIQNCQSKEQLMVGLKHLVGIPDAEGNLATLGGGTNYADRDIANSDGKTFMDVLQDHHPEWVEEFVNELRAYPTQYKLPDLEISKVLMLEGPDGLLRLEKNPDPYLLMDESIPEVRPLDSVASEQERSEHVRHIARSLVKIQALKTTASTEKIQLLNSAAENILKEQSPDTKMQACIMFAQDENMDSHKLNAQAMLLQNLGHTMRSGSDAEKRLVFDTFERADLDLQFRITALLKAQSVTLAGQSSTLGESDQSRFDIAVQGLQTAASAFESHMAAQARNKYGIENIAAENQNKPKSDTP